MSVAEVLKPYLWLAAIAFFVGFISYMTLGTPAPTLFEQQDVWPAEASAPVSDEWNAPKRI